MKRQTLETVIREYIAAHDPETRFDVIAFELWGNRREGFDCNDKWFIRRNADLPEVLNAARGRWEIFKLNYLPAARVSDLEDTGWEDTVSLEIDAVPFLEIRPVKP